MKRALLALTLAASALLPAVAGAECLSSSQAVFAAHPKAAHAAWEGRSQPGRKCWFAGYPGDQRAPAPKKQAARKSSPQPEATPPVPTPAVPIAAPPPPAPVAPAAPVLAPDSIEFALALAKAKIVLADRLVQFQAQRRKEAAR